MTMQLYTVEEHRLAEAIRDNAPKLVALALKNRLTMLTAALDSAVTGKKLQVNESAETPHQLITRVLSESHTSRLALARSILAVPSENNYRARKFALAIDEIKGKLGLSEALDHTKSYLRQLVEVDLNVNKTAQEVADILYHLDVATRHIDALVGFGLVAKHSDEIVSISSDMQLLAQHIRDELGGESSITIDKPAPVPQKKKVSEV